ncbi:MAG TPA: DMT family transporter [Planctomycetes bacterium]|nr:DMT family transporter [Planctomycetota bacterium]
MRPWGCVPPRSPREGTRARSGGGPHRSAGFGPCRSGRARRGGRGPVRSRRAARGGGSDLGRTSSRAGKNTPPRTTMLGLVKGAVEFSARGAPGADGLEERRRLHGLVALVFVQFAFGLFPVLVKLARAGGEGFETRGLASWRILVGAVVLGGVAFARHGRSVFLGRGDLVRLALCAALGVVANQVLALEGVARTSATQAGILFTLIPVFTFAVAVFLRQERPSARRAAGIGLALLGAILLVLGHGTEGADAPDPVGGALLIVANSLAYAFYLVLARDLLARIPSLVVIAWVFVLSLWAPPLMLSLGDGASLLPRVGTREAWLGLAGLLLFPTVFAYLVNTFALARVPASVTAVFIYLQPLVSVGTAALVLGERPGPRDLGAGLLLFAGIALVARMGGWRD